MSNETALQQARALLEQLTENARKGAIIPVRLPGQIEEITALLVKAEEEQAEAAKKAASGGEGREEYLKEQASFMSHAIHELRNPMTSIRGYADMLGNAAMGPLNDMQKQFVETIRTNSRRMEGLLTDVSDMSKLRGGTLKTNSKMDMYKNIAMMIDKAARPTADNLTKTLTFDTPSGLPILETDGELLTKAIVKLVENALRYSNENGEVKVNATGENNVLTITVEDNGIGMTPEEMSQLGTIYYRSDNELVRTFKGSGLGIPIAYGIIKLLGGTVDVKSEVDKGTTFTITLKGMG